MWSTLKGGALDRLYLLECINLPHVLVCLCVCVGEYTHICVKALCYLFYVTSTDKSKLCVIRRGHALGVVCCLNWCELCVSSCPSGCFVEAYLNCYYGNGALLLYRNPYPNGSLAALPRLLSHFLCYFFIIFFPPVPPLSRFICPFTAYPSFFLTTAHFGLRHF